MSLLLFEPFELSLYYVFASSSLPLPFVLGGGTDLKLTAQVLDFGTGIPLRQDVSL